MRSFANYEKMKDCYLLDGIKDINRVFVFVFSDFFFIAVPPTFALYLFGDFEILILFLFP